MLAISCSGPGRVKIVSHFEHKPFSDFINLSLFLNNSRTRTFQSAATNGTFELPRKD
jgi:hypothetical protein